MAFTAIPDKSVGDPVTEAMWDAIKDDVNAGVFRPFADVRLSAAAANIDIQNIPGTHAGLLVVLHGRLTVASANPAQFRFNNDSGANYDYQDLGATATTRAGANTFGATLISQNYIPGTNAPAGVFSQFTLWVPNYASTVPHKAVTGAETARSTTGTNGQAVYRFGGVWRSTAAITRVTALAASGNLEIGSRLTIYGVGAP